MAQINTLAEELNVLRAEVVQGKANHAALPQANVDANAAATRPFLEQGARTTTLERKVAEVDAGDETSRGGTQTKPLIEPKQVNVPDFMGSMTDGRAKFLEREE